MSHFNKQTINVAKQDITENEFYIYMQTLALKAPMKDSSEFSRPIFHEHNDKTTKYP